MAEKKNKEAVVKIVTEKPAKKAPAKKPATDKAAAEVKKTPVKKAAPQAAEAVKAEPVKETAAAVAATETPVAKKPAKKAPKAKAPLYINGRYVVEKQLPAKPQKGAKPYAEAKKQIKVTLVKSTAGCLKDQQATVRALGLTKIRSSNVLPDNAAIRGMVFKVKHLVVVEEVK